MGPHDYARTLVVVEISLLRSLTTSIKNHPIMGRTRKDSARQSTNRLVLKVVVNDDGTYQIALNDKVVERHVPEKWLDAELCAKRGFCGEELADIKRQLQEKGRAIYTV